MSRRKMPGPPTLADVWEEVAVAMDGAEVAEYVRHHSDMTQIVRLTDILRMETKSRGKVLKAALVLEREFQRVVAQAQQEYWLMLDVAPADPQKWS